MLGRIRATAAAARESGALLSIETDQLIVRTQVTPFLVRKVANLKRKDEAASKRAADAVSPAKQAKPAKDRDFNPFLPYEEAMFVENIQPAHVCLLNKFNVVEDHILVVTRDFESQGSLLNVGDFRAIWLCLSEVDGLAFYNAGRIAGASQRHKHAQLVPTPLVKGLGDGVRTPFDHILMTGCDHECVRSGRPYSSPHLPFLHRISRLDGLQEAAPNDVASMLAERYTALLSSLAIDVGVAHLSVGDGDGGSASTDNLSGAGKNGLGASGVTVDDGRGLDVCQPYPYNLLMTRDWLLIVPRRKEYFEGEFEGRISVNSLGFCGSLFVRDESQLAYVEKDPMAVLAHVSYPRPEKCV